MDRGACQARVLAVAKSDMMQQLNNNANTGVLGGVYSTGIGIPVAYSWVCASLITSDVSYVLRNTVLKNVSAADINLTFLDHILSTTVLCTLYTINNTCNRLLC